MLLVLFLIIDASFSRRPSLFDIKFARGRSRGGPVFGAIASGGFPAESFRFKVRLPTDRGKTCIKTFPEFSRFYDAAPRLEQLLNRPVTTDCVEERYAAFATRSFSIKTAEINAM